MGVDQRVVRPAGPGPRYHDRRVRSRAEAGDRSPILRCRPATRHVSNLVWRATDGRPVTAEVGLVDVGAAQLLAELDREVGFRQMALRGIHREHTRAAAVCWNKYNLEQRPVRLRHMLAAIILERRMESIETVAADQDVLQRVEEMTPETVVTIMVDLTYEASNMDERWRRHLARVCELRCDNYWRCARDKVPCHQPNPETPTHQHQDTNPNLTCLTGVQGRQEQPRRDADRRRHDRARRGRRRSHDCKRGPRVVAAGRAVRRIVGVLLAGTGATSATSRGGTSRA